LGVYGSKGIYNFINLIYFFVNLKLPFLKGVIFTHFYIIKGVIYVYLCGRNWWYGIENMTKMIIPK